MISFYGLNRRSNKILATLFVLLAVSGCANTGQLFSSGGEEIKGCVKRVAKSAISNLEMVNFAVQDCLGEAKSYKAKNVRTHAAILILANYGARSIALNKLEDEEAAAGQALILKHRIEKAIVKLNQIRGDANAKAEDDLISKMLPNYRHLTLRQPGDVQLFGVMRAALSPVAWRGRKTFREYTVAAGSGGVGGVVGKLLSRRKIIFAKGESLKNTFSLGRAAIFDTRCLLHEIDSRELGKSDIIVDAVNDKETEENDFKCSTNFPGSGLEAQAWKAMSDWLNETKKTLDELAIPSD